MVVLIAVIAFAALVAFYVARATKEKREYIIKCWENEDEPEGIQRENLPEGG